jgi:hypothetical protein
LAVKIGWSGGWLGCDFKIFFRTAVSPYFTSLRPVGGGEDFSTLITLKGASLTRINADLKEGRGVETRRDREQKRIFDFRLPILD